MARIPRFRQRSLYTLERRAGLLWRRLGLNRFLRDKTVRRIEINGRSYKRLAFADSYIARRVVANLEPFRELELFPKLVAEHDRELLLEFVPGHSLLGERPEPFVERIAAFFCTLYGVGCRPIPLADSRFDRDLRGNLDFLRDVGVLAGAARGDLDAALERLAPEEVWIGYDYLDPLLKNFVETVDGRIVAIDVEEVVGDQLVGTGLAKAVLRDLEPVRERLLDEVDRKLPFDLRGRMPYLELHFLAHATKRALLKGRDKLVEPAAFDRYRVESRRGGDV